MSYDDTEHFRDSMYAMADEISFLRSELAAAMTVVQHARATVRVWDESQDDYRPEWLDDALCALADVTRAWALANAAAHAGEDVAGTPE